MATATEKYNGWTNYETWNVNLWIQNEQGSESYWREITEETYSDAVAERSWTRKESARFTLADRLKSEIEEANPVADQANMWADLMGAALSEVASMDEATHAEDE